MTLYPLYIYVRSRPHHTESAKWKQEKYTSALTVALVVVSADQIIAALVVGAAAGVFLVAVGLGFGVCSIRKT